MVCSALETHCFVFLHQIQASAGHQTAGPQDPVSTGVGGHAGAVGEFKSEPADVLSPASSAETEPGGGESVLDHSTDSVVLLRRNGRTDEGLNCKDVSPSSLCVTHRGSTTVSNVELSFLVPHRSSLHASDA